jgi:hypothetical protein
MVWKMRTAVVAVFVLVAAGAVPAAAAPQAAQPVTFESFVGTWDGSAETPSGNVSLHAVFQVKDGKFGGTIESSMGAIPIVSAALTDEKLVLTIDFQGSPGMLACKLQGNRIDGVWEVGGNSGSFSLTRGGAGASAAAGDPLSGTWAGDVQIAGQTMAFSMDLRLAGAAVSGEMISEAGKTPLASGSWKDGTLLIAFPYVGGEPVAMSAQLQDGKLVGAVDYNKGEAAGTWTAARKK